MIWRFSISLCIASIFCTISHSQTWSPKANFGGGTRYQAIGFSIGSKGYVGLGNSGAFNKDLWEYDPTTNAWTQKANFGGTARETATSFCIGTKAYVGLGLDASGLLNDLWEYDQPTNSWSQKSNFPGAARYGAVGFSIGNYGYMGTGLSAGTIITNDFWQYDPVTDSWIQKANVGGTVRYYAVGFSVNSQGFIGTGFDPSGTSGTPGYKQDFWRYDPVANIWTQVAGLPAASRMEAVGFSSAARNKGYVGTGYFAGPGNFLNDFWEYDPVANNWQQLQNFGGTPRDFAMGFAIDSCCYIGTGWDPFKRKDFWEYGTCAVCIPPSLSVSADITICSGTSGIISATASSGVAPYTYSWIPAIGLTCPTCASTAASPTITTTYSIIATDDGSCPDTSFITVTVIPSPTVSAGPDVTVNHVQNTTLTASGNTGYTWNTGPMSPSIVVHPTSTTMYTVLTTDPNGCTAMDTVFVFVDPIKAPVYFPNAFSPNEDGENDILQLCFDDWLITDASLFIYNRLGELVFGSSDKNFQWDGSYKGAKLNSSVLSYDLTIHFADGSELKQKGNISLLR